MEIVSFHVPQAMSPYASAVLLLIVALGAVQFAGMVFHKEVHTKR